MSPFSWGPLCTTPHHVVLIGIHNESIWPHKSTFSTHLVSGIETATSGAWIAFWDICPILPHYFALILSPLNGEISGDFPLQQLLIRILIRLSLSHQELIWTEKLCHGPFLSLEISLYKSFSLGGISCDKQWRFPDNFLPDKNLPTFLYRHFSTFHISTRQFSTRQISTRGGHFSTKTFPYQDIFLPGFFEGEVP